eukprot:gene2746-biopygen536
MAGCSPSPLRPRRRPVGGAGTVNRPLEGQNAQRSTRAGTAQQAAEIPNVNLSRKAAFLKRAVVAVQRDHRRDLAGVDGERVVVLREVEREGRAHGPRMPAVHHGHVPAAPRADVRRRRDAQRHVRRRLPPHRRRQHHLPRAAPCGSARSEVVRCVSWFWRHRRR